MTVVTYDEVLHRLKLLFDQGSTKVADAAEPQDDPPDDIPRYRRPGRLLTA